MKVFDLEIVTPEASIFSGKVQSVQVPGSMGSFQVLINHAPIISTLGKGKVKLVKEDGEALTFNTEDGVVEVLKNKAIILVEKVIEA
ncbi:MAG: ATP synthase F1 subunit epsilon [Bacteroidetes bacterium]|nr:MAG: ATP synthase F1 subunit epsilon [Bacteroidota bacterium]